MREVLGVVAENVRRRWTERRERELGLIEQLARAEETWMTADRPRPIGTATPKPDELFWKLWGYGR